MRKFILITFAALALATPTTVLATPAAASRAPLVISMRDPGCHWFYLGGGPNHRKYAKTVSRTGPVTLLNLDEAALKVKGDPVPRGSSLLERSSRSGPRASTTSRWWVRPLTTTT